MSSFHTPFGIEAQGKMGHLWHIPKRYEPVELPFSAAQEEQNTVSCPQLVHPSIVVNLFLRCSFDDLLPFAVVNPNGYATNDHILM